MSIPSIRRAGPDDAAALARLYGYLDPTSRPDPARIAGLLARLERYPDYCVYLAEREGRPVGTYALLVMETLGSRCAPAAVVEDVVVDPEERGRGVGRAMMEDAMRRAVETGCYKLVLSSNERRTDAHAFYEALGFRRHGVSFIVEPPRG